MAAARPLRSSATGLVPGDHPFDCLMRGTRDLRGPAVRAHLTVGRNDVHPFPRRLQWKLPGRCGDWLTSPPSPPGPQPPGRHDERGMGTFNWPPAETSTRPHTGTFSWPRTYVVCAAIPLMLRIMLAVRLLFARRAGESGLADAAR